MSEFTVQVGAFSGPLAVLLELVEKRKLSVSEVSLARVADDFIAYVRAHTELPKDETAHFIVVAATLLLIKSRALVPKSVLSDEEEEQIHELERRLALHKVYTSVEGALRAIMQEEGHTLPPPRAAATSEPIFAPGPDITLHALQEHMATLIRELPAVEHLPEAAMEDTVISIKEMMQSILARVGQAPQTLTELAGGRQELVVAFLALLELVKDGHLTALQEVGGEISITLVHTV